MAKLGLNQSELPKIDEEFEAIIPRSRDEELTRKAKLKTKWPRSKRLSEIRSVANYFHIVHKVATT